MASSSFFNDDPADGTTDAPDVLGRQPYAEHAVRMLRRVRQQSDSGVLALIGPWGSGKSSVLGMVTRLLQQPGQGEPWLIAELNPWMYPDLDSLATALFSEIRQCLPSDARWGETRKRLAAFGKAVSPLGAWGCWLESTPSSCWKAWPVRWLGTPAPLPPSGRSRPVCVT